MSTAASDNRQNHTSCHCQLTSKANAIAPVTAAAMPNHMRNMPGDRTSSANRIAAMIIQVQGPSVKRALIVAAPYTEGTAPPGGRTRGVVVTGGLGGLRGAGGVA